MSDNEKIVRSLFWSSGLSDEELSVAIGGFVRKSFDEGAYVCHRDDLFDYWTGVDTGLIKLSTVSESGKAITFAGISNGGWFGEGALLKNEPRRYDVVALRKTSIHMLSRKAFMWLHENSIGFNRVLVQLLNERLAQFIATVEHDRGLDAKARVARSLSWLFNPILSPGASGTIEISQDELASLCGVSRSAVNRSLQDLDNEGLIRAQAGRVTALSVAKLITYGD